MANPLQPKCISILEKEFGAYVVNVMAASRSGNMDLIVCIRGTFWGFEIKWKSDTPSIAQKEKINKCIAAGGKAFFVRSTEELRNFILLDAEPIEYVIKPQYKL